MKLLFCSTYVLGPYHRKYTAPFLAQKCPKIFCEKPSLQILVHAVSPGKRLSLERLAGVSSLPPWLWGTLPVS